MTNTLHRAERLARATLLLLMLSGTLGCAVKMPVVELYPSIPEQGVLRDESDRPITLGLIPLADQRPQVQRRGQRPRAWIFLLYNHRIGTYVTGDRSFARPAARSVSEGLAEALNGSRFGGAQLLDDGPSRHLSDALDTCAEGDLEYVAVGSLDALYGTTEQRTWFTLVPVPFFSVIGWNHDVSDALGVIGLDLEIIRCDSSESVYRRRITRRLRFPGESPTAAARLAFFEVLEQIRDETLPR